MFLIVIQSKNLCEVEQHRIYKYVLLQCYACVSLLKFVDSSPAGPLYTSLVLETSLVSWFSSLFLRSNASLSYVDISYTMFFSSCAVSCTQNLC
jgi:hypothetical protein